MNYRNKDLLDAAKGQPCMCCGAEDDTIVAAHSNQSRHGKGMSIKAHDCFIAFLCSRCHYRLDQGKELTRQERIEMWQEAHDKTLLHLFQTERLTVRKL